MIHVSVFSVQCASISVQQSVFSDQGSTWRNIQRLASAQAAKHWSSQCKQLPLGLRYQVSCRYLLGSRHVVLCNGVSAARAIHFPRALRSKEFCGLESCLPRAVLGFIFLFFWICVTGAILMFQALTTASGQNGLSLLHLQCSATVVYPSLCLLRAAPLVCPSLFLQRWLR
jgi:hypothetical protein